ncbi:hypothetical protein RM697_06690 [Ichthyenterobacterium sp. W332]|uniref:Uncharacterized protein n=1 Tax=Microcosmobacter mediterraneus TaxID=3075607 RepID=A0ABU2YJH9_9FLAO|nr:hypothetical protein [Ichthyenterobacterium sp. W332]MDT0558324.1 hypothetical protein [Ichthyenterobacterium sp. W332]
MNYRKNKLKIVIPLSIICFTIFNKWWYVVPVDAPKSFMYGFPLISVSEGWHTSMSLQIFLLEYFINYLLFFVVTLLLTFYFDRFIMEIRFSRVWIVPLYFISVIIIVLNIYVASMTENIIKVKRDFEIEIQKTGFNFIWQNRDREHM